MTFFDGGGQRAGSQRDLRLLDQWLQAGQTDRDIDGRDGPVV